MMKLTVPSLYLALSLITALAAQAEPFSPAVKAAQDAYLKGDGTRLLKEMKAGLMAEKNHPLVAAHFSGLYTAAEQNGVLKGAEVDWKLPAEVAYLKIENQRRYFADTGRVRFFLTVTGILKAGHEVEQLQVIRFPDQVVYDRQAKVGEWYEEKWQGQPSFWGASDRSSKPTEEGLYLLNIKVKSQPMMQGWFLLANANASAAPVIQSPAISGTVNGPQPLFRWTDFHSPEFKKGEITKLNVRINRPVGEDEEEVMSGSFDGGATSFRVGDREHIRDYEGANELAPGNYVFTLAYGERHRFGDIMIGRGSSTKIPFTVK